MTTLQESAYRRPSISAAVEHTNTLASVESKLDSSLPSAADMELAELLKTAQGDSASALRQSELLAKPQPSRIAVKAKGKIFFVEPADIITVHAQGNYASLKCRSSPYLLRESLGSIAVKLKPCGFIQIHRSVLVNASLVDEVWPMSTGEYRLRIRNGAEYVVTRRYKDNLRELARVWLGSEGVFSSARME